MKQAKRFLSILLMLCMLLGMLPSAVFAADRTMPFTDVAETDWFYDAVQYVYDNDMMSGTGDAEFSPNATTTRGMIVTILHRMEGLPAAPGAAFTDVPAGQWYAGAVAWASSNSIVSGYGDGAFGPDDPITREQMAAILYRYVQYKGYDDTVTGDVSGFADSQQVSAYAAEAMSWAVGAELISGVGGNLLAPTGSATRAQIAVILMRFCESTAVSGPSTGETYTVTFDYNYSNKGTYKTQTVSRGETAESPSAPTRSGYTFNGWYTKPSGGSKFDFDSEITGDITLYAHWSSPDSGSSSSSSERYTVTFECNGGSAVASQTVRDGRTASEPEAPQREGYRFQGWYTDSALTQAYDFSTPVRGNLTLYAGWISSTAPEQCTVTFVLNDGNPGAYARQVLEFGALAQQPQDPERENYAFTGWYTQPQAVTKYDFSSPVTEDVTLYAGWTAPAGEEPEDGVYGSVTGGGTIYSITDIRMDQNQVQVTVNTDSISALVVRFLEEPETWSSETIASGAVLATVSAQTPEYCELVPVSIPVEQTLPEYYVIQAVLLDENGEELCDPYTCVRYTSRYAAFAGQTVEDFPQDRVLNFDQDPTQNFGVLTERVLDLRQEGTASLVRQFSQDPDEPFVYSDYYVFEQAGEAVLALDEGDLVLAQGEDGVLYLFKVDTKEVYSDGTAAFTPDQNVSLSEFYETLNVSMDLNLEDAQLAQGANTPQTMMEIIDVDGEWSGSIGGSIHVDWDPVEINGELRGTGTVALEMTYDAKLFGEDYFYCSVVSKLELTLDLDVEAEANNDEKVEAELKLAKVTIPTPIPGLSVYFAPTVPTEWKISGGGSFEFKSKTSSGFTYDTYSGRQTVDKKERSINLSLQGEAEISIGPKVALGLAFLEQVVKAEVNAQAGAKASASTELGGSWTDAESKHACTLCLDGECKWFIAVKAKLSFCIVEDVLDATPIDATLINVEGWINFLSSRPGQFYISLINSADSCFGGRIHFGGGDCPNKAWRVTIQTQDANGNELTGVNTSVFKSNYESVGNGASPYTLYLYDGLYRVEATVSGTAVSKSFVVNEAPAEVTLTPTSANGKISGKIFDADTNQSISGASILIKQGDMVIASCTSNQSGSYEAVLPDGVYRIEITKSGYIPFVIYETIEDGRTTYLESAMMIQGNSQLMGGFSGQITDAVTGAPVSGVSLSVRSGWNNSGDGDVMATLTTDGNGRFESGIINVFGVIFGLPSGNYTVTASKPGYVTTSFNVVVLPGVVTSGQDGTISPEMETTDGEYRVVLTWGQTPSDLDSHYNAITASGVRDHIYYSSKVGYSANLDVDDTTSYGPETVTVTSFENLSNGFVYSVHNYSNRSSTSSSALSASGAIVRLYNGNTLLRTYNVPTDREGTVWNVFSIDQYGNIVDLNTFEYISSPGSVGAGYTSANSIALFGEDEPEILKDYEQAGAE